VALDNDFINARGSGEERALNADTIGRHAANSKGRVGAILSGVQDCAFEFLDALARTFANLHVYTHDITSAKIRNIRIYGCLNGFHQFAHS
jgi:hypothetical protein